MASDRTFSLDRLCLTGHLAEPRTRDNWVCTFLFLTLIISMCADVAALCHACMYSRTAGG